MELIETQASDLRYLAQAPVALSDTSYDTPQPPPGGEDSAANTNKRKPAADDGGPSDGQRQTRSKRNRYISIACNECKRRKIKCNGETPCQRCGNLNLACLYAPNCCSSSFKDSDDFKHVLAQVARLQDDVAWLTQSLRSLAPANALASANPARAPSPSRASPVERMPSHPSPAAFRGPTSIAYSLDVANSTIANMGWRAPADPDVPEQPPTQPPAPPPAQLPMAADAQHWDPLFDFDKDEMVRLCQFYEDETGIMYPVLNIQTVIAHAKTIAPILHSARTQQRAPAILGDEKTLQLKIILCCALAVENHGHSDKAAQLYETIADISYRKLMAEVTQVSHLPFLCILGGYRFLSNDEVLAWRVMGQVVRLCVELGIHQKRGLMRIQDEFERKNALNTFWSAYVLERRWGFATGLPSAVQDDEIDPQLPFPEGYPYLVAMITYSRLGAKVWRQVSHFGHVLARELRKEEIESLDGEILQWYDTVPEEIKMRSWDKEKHMTSTPSYNLQRLRIWTYLRLNQIRTWLYTPILYSATSIMSHMDQARRALDLAKDTIQYLNHLNSTTNLYRRLQVFYHQFLMSAIAVVFLAAVHAPLHFSASCREEFYLALNLVKDLSAKSWISQRLWRTVKSLKDVAPRFGLNPDDDAHSSAALGMIGLARGHADPSLAAEPPFPGLAMATPQQQQVPEPQLRQNGKQLQNELSRIFEGYVGLNSFQLGPPGDEHVSASDLASSGSAGSVCATDGIVFSQLRDIL